MRHLLHRLGLGPDPALLTLAELRARVEALAAVADVPADHLPTYGRSADYARPHLEVDSAYHWVVVERGQEFERRTTRDPDELLYWVFDAAISEGAGKWELAHRVPGLDTRRGRFARQLELMGRLDPRWRDRLAARLDAVLARHPYRDEP